jgi:hypothetical protein
MSQSPDPAVENFDLNLDAPSSEEEEGTPRVTNTHTVQHPASPSSRQQRASRRPAGSKKPQPDDALTFFEKSDDNRKCKFCM